MWTFLFGVVIAGALYLKISELRTQNEQLTARLMDLRLEINAVRQAFLQRISALEKRAPGDPVEAPPEVIEEAVVEPVPVVEEPAEPEPPAPTPQPAWTPEP